jgi:hypothetical protein
VCFVAALGQRNRRADRRVAGKRQLAAGRENAQAVVGHRVAARQDEHGLRQVELARNRLHLRRVEAIGVKHHGQRIAGQTLGGENIIDRKSARHGGTHNLRVMATGQ